MSIGGMLLCHVDGRLLCSQGRASGFSTEPSAVPPWFAKLVEMSDSMQWPRTFDRGVGYGQGGGGTAAAWLFAEDRARPFNGDIQHFCGCASTCGDAHHVRQMNARNGCAGGYLHAPPITCASSVP